MAAVRGQAACEGGPACSLNLRSVSCRDIDEIILTYNLYGSWCEYCERDGYAMEPKNL